MPSRSTLIAFLALFAALAGTATAAKLIDGKDIRKGTVASKQVADRSLTTRDLSKSAVRSLRRDLAPVTGTRIADGTVGLADLAPSSVGSTQIVDRSISGGDIGADALTQTELGIGSVGDTELADLSVGNEELKNNSISQNKIRPSVLRTGAVRATFPAIPDGTCSAQAVPGATYNIPANAFTGTVIEVETPADLPAGVIVDARSTDNSNLQVQVCNFSGGAVGAGEREFRFAAIGT